MRKLPPKRRPNYVSNYVEDIDPSNASSATDCTGLIPTPPQSDFELESYKAVYDFAPPDAADCDY